MSIVTGKGLSARALLLAQLLMMLVSAFAGRAAVMSAYETAKQEGYRFLSFGDAMLIL